MRKIGYLLSKYINCSYLNCSLANIVIYIYIWIKLGVNDIFDWKFKKNSKRIHWKEFKKRSSWPNWPDSQGQI